MCGIFLFLFHLDTLTIIYNVSDSRNQSDCCHEPDDTFVPDLKIIRAGHNAAGLQLHADENEYNTQHLTHGFYFPPNVGGNYFAVCHGNQAQAGYCKFTEYNADNGYCWCDAQLDEANQYGADQHFVGKGV